MFIVYLLRLSVFDSYIYERVSCCCCLAFFFFFFWNLHWVTVCYCTILVFHMHWNSLALFFHSFVICSFRTVFAFVASFYVTVRCCIRSSCFSVCRSYTHSDSFVCVFFAFFYMHINGIPMAYFRKCAATLTHKTHAKLSLLHYRIWADFSFSFYFGNMNVRFSHSTSKSNVCSHLLNAFDVFA